MTSCKMIHLLKQQLSEKREKHEMQIKTLRWNPKCDPTLFFFPMFSERHIMNLRKTIARVQSHAKYIPLCFSIRSKQTNQLKSPRNSTKTYRVKACAVLHLEVQPRRRRWAGRREGASAAPSLGQPVSIKLWQLHPHGLKVAVNQDASFNPTALGGLSPTTHMTAYLQLYLYQRPVVFTMLL